LLQIPSSDESDVNRAVECAKLAFPSWSGQTVQTRYTQHCIVCGWESTDFVKGDTVLS